MKLINQSPEVLQYWKKTIDLLLSIGFVVYDERGDGYDNCIPAFDVDIENASCVLIEAVLSNDHLRNRICVVLKEECEYDIWVQHNIACGFIFCDFFRWSEITFDWLNDFKKGITGNGFTLK